MKVVALVFSLFAMLLTGCGDSTQPGQKSSPTGDGNAVTAPVDYLSSAGQSQKKAVNTIDLVALNKAVEAFYVQEGRFPKTLEELQEKNYLRVIPSAPTGVKINYDSTNGVVTLEKE